MTQDEGDGPQAFFLAMRDSFDRILAAGRGDPRLVDALTAQAFDSFDRNCEIQSEGQPDPACVRGCDTCCCLHVSATAPEIFLAARFLRLTAPAFARHGVDMGGKLASAHVATDGKSQQERFSSCLMCPFIIGGACAIYSVRTLACRGHVSFDKEAARRRRPARMPRRCCRPPIARCVHWSKAPCRRLCATPDSTGAPANSWPARPRHEG